MKLIVHPTDFSENAAPALRWAAHLARLSKAKLLVFNAFDVPVFAGYPHDSYIPGFEERTVSRHRAKLVSWVSEIIPDIHNDVDLSFDSFGEPLIAQAITKLLVRQDADLVVVGTRGSSRLKEIFLGSTTRELFNLSPCPVLAVPPNAPISKTKKIAYATDLHAKDKTALKKLKEIAELFDASIIATHVMHNSKSLWNFEHHFVPEVEEELNYEKLEFATLPHGNVYHRLMEFVHKEQIGVLAMLERERGLLTRAWRQDRVMQVGFNSPVPVLTFNENQLW